jgi:peptidoglycan/LPS O-acetylase OafA/YrhL
MATLPWITHYGFGFPAAIITGLFFIPVACGNSLFGLLNFRGFRLMGIVSYSVYLLHGVALYVAHPLLQRLRSTGSQQPLHYWLGVLGVGAAVLLLSMVTYRLIELPFMRAEKRLRQRGNAEQGISMIRHDLPGTTIAIFPPSGAAKIYLPLHETPEL